MAETIEIRMLPEVYADAILREKMLDEQCGVGIPRSIVKKSLDARRGKVFWLLRYQVGKQTENASHTPIFNNVKMSKDVHVIGAGPAGLFAALALIEKGFKPILWERGKEVKARRRDLALLTREHQVNPDSNYCFGEGGAGTFSDGKLYTRSQKRGDVVKVLSTLVYFGAPSEILYESRPHIGTNKLPGIIERIRHFILEAGGEIHFNRALSDLEWSPQLGIRTLFERDGTPHRCNSLILATGHSARDIYQLLDRVAIPIQAKPFALGVRAEHPQAFIDQLQYGRYAKDSILPPASYSVVEQVRGRGVYSFCMCPGGIIAPCSTSSEEIVTNGWSPSKRNNRTANSGIVVELRIEDLYALAGFESPLAGLAVQQKIEKKAWEVVGKGQTAPAMRLSDISNGKPSHSLPDCSYFPGIHSVPMHEILPPFVWDRLKDGLIAINRKMPGFIQEDALIVGVESRTSSPVRIPRDRQLGHHPSVKNLFPCGEGPGFAGGIVSAAIDGIWSAHKVAEQLN
jgi:uncharacterized FAD-dependent dehydrogenase